MFLLPWISPTVMPLLSYFKTGHYLLQDALHAYPTTGDGSVAKAMTMTPGGKPMFLANFEDFKNLIEDFNHLTLEHVMAFASWFMGDINNLLPSMSPQTWKLSEFLSMQLVMKVLLPALSSFKQECCTLYHVVCTLAHNQQEPSFVHVVLGTSCSQEDFAYECTETGHVY